jgi:hypothetical protein
MTTDGLPVGKVESRNVLFCDNIADRNTWMQLLTEIIATSRPFDDLAQLLLSNLKSEGNEKAPPARRESSLKNPPFSDSLSRTSNSSINASNQPQETNMEISSPTLLTQNGSRNMSSNFGDQESLGSLGDFETILAMPAAAGSIKLENDQSRCMEHLPPIPLVEEFPIQVKVAEVKSARGIQKKFSVWMKNSVLEKTHSRLFGCTIQEAVDTASIMPGYEIPTVLYRCIEYLEAKNAAHEEGIYRLSGSSTTVTNLRQRFEQGIFKN